MKCFVLFDGIYLCREIRDNQELLYMCHCSGKKNPPENTKNIERVAN